VRSSHGGEAAAVVACLPASFPQHLGPLFMGKNAVLLFDGDNADR